MPFADLADGAARGADLASPRARLEKSGGLGRPVGRLVERAPSRTPRS